MRLKTKMLIVTFCYSDEWQKWCDLTETNIEIIAVCFICEIYAIKVA